MFKKFLAVLIVCLGIFSINVPANATVAKIDSGLNFQQMTSGYEGYATVVNCNEWISLREYPSTSAPRLAKVPLGATVQVFKFNGMDGADPSPYNGQYGWCLLSYLRINSSRERA